MASNKLRLLLLDLNLMGRVPCSAVVRARVYSAYGILLMAHKNRTVAQRAEEQDTGAPADRVRQAHYPFLCIPS